MRKTKIVCTLGPASNNEETISELINAGMDIARFNFSHGDHEGHLATHRMVEKVRKNFSKPVATLLDTKGPEVRLCKFQNGKITLKSNTEFTLKKDSNFIGDEKACAITYSELYKDLTVGTTILADDGLIELKVKEIKDTDIICTVVNGGELSDKKSINVPGINLSLPFVSEKDYEDIIFGIKTGFDFIAASFTRTADDILQIRKILDDNDCHTIKIIAKIENNQGVENIDDILRVSDGVMVARGDMGVEIPIENVPIIQKMMIKKAYMAGKHVITATQMLDSMMRNPRPTRAEAADVANAIYDGTSAIMLSGETAAGKYPIESVKTMARIAERIEQDINYKSMYFTNDENVSASLSDITNAISHATCTTAYDLDAAAIITVTQSGHTARMCSRFRIDKPIIACTPSEHTFRQLSISWGVTPLMVDYRDNYEDLFNHAVEETSKAGFVQDGELVVLTAGVPIGVTGTTNLLKVQMVGNVILSGKSLVNKSVISPVCVCKDEKEALSRFNSGDILVIPRASEKILTILRKASAVVTENPDENSYEAIVAKALDIPVIIGAKSACSIIKNGSTVKVDGEKGMVCNCAADK